MSDTGTACVTLEFVETGITSCCGIWFKEKWKVSEAKNESFASDVAWETVMFAGMATVTMLDTGMLATVCCPSWLTSL
jgi:hypothetical protein